MAHIDALRGISALLVAWQHTSERFVQLPGVADKGTLLFDLANRIDFGRVGIICFFLISGFVIPFSLQSHTDGAIKRFAIRRFFRLYPVYWLSILVVVGIGYIWGDHIGVIEVAANTTMMQRLFGEPHLIGLYWTLQVELVFYILCAVIFYYGHLDKHESLFSWSLFCFLLFVLSQGVNRASDLFAGVDKEIMYSPYILSIMFLGALYRNVYENKELNVKSRRQVVIATCVCFGFPIGVYLFSKFGVNLSDRPFQFGVAHTVAWCMFVVSGLCVKRVPVFFLWLGAISYSVYLFHPIVMEAVIKMAQSASMRNGYHLSVYMTVVLLITVLVSSAIYVCLEKPSIQFGHSLTKKDKEHR